ncbi:RpiR family glv operon transcriptional regulator [Clostridium saccharoperbutylacetonicum]|uniref:HTH-type transcriptional regulator GlvR n=1 Tax=Clostridium saccharoperbutylacetonicum N1-4(HMT) TaxID=931276 RepID=M1MGQ3_9CLOT|nr:MurR/RpiR family transcriptional regulator [Clostridium saccharoperbutylacetonicum]AGF55523.1 HTH-type transcriptional regulator GlvR [Clostridium saccharoperbutylacetonicum N1-4(HMT)]NRT63758.1 RpiR family glv operon transcriptional regulator [Clostridium saccharoperbutylacetonicum]NSB27121.1 RpiR family glv operon transcriptional regulator [Clostridium saccharoperbutylacetonicum]NSB40607.1 RpiR family glv operon transcriptional regulator [Clostridium saccharoperbutylacetonicum]
MKLEELINKNYSKLNENDIYILKYVLKSKIQCCNLGINELAKRCNVSKTTILRCIKKLEFEGYSEFKVHLKLEESNVYSESEEDNNIEKLITDINQTINYFKNRDFTKICKLIYEAEKVFVYGTGAPQRVVAQALKQTFFAVNKYLYVIEGEGEFEGLTDKVGEKDLIIIISLSGNTASLEKYTNKLSLKGIEYVSITKLINNKLSTKTPYNLYATTSEFRLDSGNSYETFTIFYILIEVLFRHYVKYEKEQKVKTLKIEE